MNILVVASHPDDEVLGCGGSLAKWAIEGHEVHILIMAEGVTSRDNHIDSVSRNEELSMLFEATNDAAAILGSSSVELLKYPDNRMDSVDLLDVVKALEVRINKLQPELVLTHFAKDLNIDHRVTHEAVITACRPQPGQSVERMLSFEVPSSTEWQSPGVEYPFVPNWFEEISGTLALKMKALKAYKSEMRQWPHVRSLQAVEHLARWRGASVGVEAAEAFMLIRNVRLS